MKRLKKRFHHHIKASSFSGRSIAIVLFILIFCKQAVVYMTYGGQLQSGFRDTLLVYLWFLGNDLIVLGTVLLFVFINMNTKNKRIKTVVNTMSWVILLLFAIDIGTIYFFQSRISIFDLYGFLTTTSGQSFSSYLSLIIGCFVILCLVAFIISQTYFKKRKDKTKQLKIASRFFGIAVCMSVINFLKYENKDLVENILTLNITALRDSIFSQWFLFAKSPNKYEEYFKNITGKAKKLNVVLVFAESFSTVDSKRSGGLYDNFPLFDKIQSNGTTFTNFMANGCTSETSHIALLQWIEPRENPLMNSTQAYDAYASMTDSLPEFFNKLKYQTTFISSVSLDFLNEYQFLSWLKFKTIIWEEAFKNKKKYVFGAAPDMELYNKTLETIKEYKTDKDPYFIALQTISSHKPYKTPYGNNEEDMFSYVDKSIYAFYQKLKQADFFKNGILVIVGDHRKMESISKEEFDKWWMSTHSRALATVIGPGIKGETYNNNITQHTDIFNSIKYLVGTDQVRVSALYNNIFNGQKNRERWVRYCRFAEKTYAVVKQNGTAYRLSSDKDKPINNYINAFKTFQAEQLLGITNFTGYHAPALNTGTVAKKDPMLIAHGWGPYGSGILDSPKMFARAYKDWADAIEFDVSYTKDDKNVVIHGPSLNTTECSKSTKQVKDYTLKEIQNKCLFRDGEKINNLEEFLKANKGLFDYYFLEIKVYDPAKAEKQTLAAINTVIKLKMENKVIFTSYDRTANYIIGSHKKIKAGRDSYSTGEVDLIYDFPHEFYLLDKSFMGPNTLKIAENMKKKLVVYTVNTKEEYEDVRKFGAKFIMTDNIPLLKVLRTNE